MRNRNYIKKICPVCNKLYCSIMCSDMARLERAKINKAKAKMRRIKKKPVRDWKPLEADGVPESDIWYHPAEPQKPSGKEPKICCNIAALPKPYLE